MDAVKIFPHTPKQRQKSELWKENKFYIYMYVKYVGEKSLIASLVT